MIWTHQTHRIDVREVRVSPDALGGDKTLHIAFMDDLGLVTMSWMLPIEQAESMAFQVQAVVQEYLSQTSGAS